MIIYADITLLNNFLMTFAIIWAIANIMEIKIQWSRTILGANIGNIYFFIVLYIQQININFFISFIVHIFLNIITAGLIIKVSFPELNKLRYLKAIAYLYLVTFITIGTTISLFYVYGGSPFDKGIQKILAGIIVLVILANTGWKIFQKYKLPEELYLPMAIYYQDKNVKLTGLLDTGNSLVDPISNFPVIVVNLEELLSLFPVGLQRELKISEDLDIDFVDMFQRYNYAHRIRLLPFSDLGQENGLLFGFRPDHIELLYQGENLKIDRCVIAISKRKLDLDDSYQALIHPRLLSFN